MERSKDQNDKWDISKHYCECKITPFLFHNRISLVQKEKYFKCKKSYNEKYKTIFGNTFC